jgi:hypothetical protein
MSILSVPSWKVYLYPLVIPGRFVYSVLVTELYHVAFCSMADLVRVCLDVSASEYRFSTTCIRSAAGYSAKTMQFHRIGTKRFLCAEVRLYTFFVLMEGDLPLCSKTNCPSITLVPARLNTFIYSSKIDAVCCVTIEDIIIAHAADSCFTTVQEEIRRC